MGRQKEPRKEIIARLRAGEAVDAWEDLSISLSGDLYVVECYLGDQPVDTAGLTAEQARQVSEDGELVEYLDTPAEAADLYLRLRELYGHLLAPPAPPES